MQVRDACKKYLKYCNEKLKFTEKSLIGYQGDLIKFEEYFAEKGLSNIEDISRKDIRGYIDYMQEKYAPRTTKRRITTARCLFSYLFENEYIDGSPMNGMNTKVRLRAEEKVVLETSEVNRILFMAYNDSSKKKLIYHYRDIAILELLFTTGLRNHELAGLKYSNWDLVNACFTYKGKGGYERVIYLENREVIVILQRYINEVKPLGSEYIFLTKFGEPMTTSAVRDVVKRYTKMAGINKKVTPHAFRRTLATMLIEDGMDISYVQQILGHKSITTTQEYVRLSKQSVQRENMRKNPRNKLSFKDYSEFKIS